MSRLERISDPIRIIADTSRRCNLDCWYCHSTSGPFYKGPELTGKDIANIYNAAEKSRAFDITITGGEPLMWNGLDEAMAASKDLEYPAVQLITNATVLTKQKLQVLKNGNLSRICVSLDGNKEIHEANRGGNTYERTLRGIQSLREVVENITVISVVDNSNSDKWPELTQDLVELGVEQHHLAPVCFAGGAMELYKGLTGEQFDQVRKTVKSLLPELPKGFILRFNDILINGPEGRTISLNSFTEGFKGWHLIVRPTGHVKTAVRAWGRSWRENETIGTIKNENLAQIISRTKTERSLMSGHKYPTEEEMKRKFHLGKVTKEEIEEDKNRVLQTELEGIPPLYSQITQESGGRLDDTYEQIFYMSFPGNLSEVAEMLKTSPGRYRLRAEDGFGFLFDRDTFNVTLFRQDEIDEISKLLPSK